MKNSICKNGTPDYFVIESIEDPQGGTTLDDLKNMGMEFNLTFHDNNTVAIKLGFAEITGTWDDNTITASDENSDESSIFNYTVENDRLTVDMGEGCAYVYRRSADMPPAREPDSGKTVETQFDDLNQKNWCMSAVCPDGWYHHNIPLFDNAILFSNSVNMVDEQASQIKFLSYTKMIAEHSVSLKGEPVKFTINGNTWKGAYNKDDMTFELFTIISDEKGEDLIVNINCNGMEPENELFQKVLLSFNIKKLN